MPGPTAPTPFWPRGGVLGPPGTWNDSRGRAKPRRIEAIEGAGWAGTPSWRDHFLAGGPPYVHLPAHPDEARDANPFTYVDRVSANRPVRYLVGERDDLCAPGDTRVVSAIVANGATEVVPGMGHEARVSGTRAFLQRHLADWRG